MKRILPIAVLMSASAVSAQDTWVGATSADWNTGSNWLDGTVPANSVTSPNTVIIGAAPLTFLPTNHNRTSGDGIFGLTVNALPGSPIVIGGNALGIGAGGIDMSLSGVDLTFNNIINTSAGGGVWTVPAGRTLTFLDVNNGNNATTAGAGTIRLSGGSGSDNSSFSIIVGGTTTLELDKSVAGGVRAIGNSLTINSGATALITNNSGDQIYQNAELTVNAGGFFNLNGRSEAMDGLSGAGAVQNTSATAVTLTVGDDTTGGTFTGSISQSSGVISLTKGEAGAGSAGSSTFLLTPSAAGNLTYTGPTTLNEGHMRINANAHTAITANSRYVLNNGTLENDATLTTFSLALGTGTGEFSFGTGSANFAANGAPLTVNLGGNAQLTWGGNFVANNQTFGFGSNFGSAAFTTTVTNPISLGGTPGGTSGSVRTLTGSGGGVGIEGDLSGVISGAAGLRKDNINTINLSNTANTYEGGTFVTGGGLGFSTAGGINAAGAGGIEAYVAPSPSTTLGGSANNGSVVYTGAGSHTAAFFASIADHNFAGTVTLSGNNANAIDFSLAPAGIRDELYLGAPAGNNHTQDGVITPANSTYRLGGGNGNLRLNTANDLTGANNLVVRDGGVATIDNAAQNMSGTVAVNGGIFELRGNSASLAGSSDIVVNGMGAHGHVSSGNLVNGYNGPSGTIFSQLKGGTLLLAGKNDNTGTSLGTRVIQLNGGSVAARPDAANNNIQVNTVNLLSGYSMLAHTPNGNGSGVFRVTDLNRATPGATVEFRSHFGTLGSAATGDFGKIRLTNINGAAAANVNGIIGGWTLASDNASTTPARFAEWDATAGVRQFTNYGATTAPASWAGGALGTQNWLANAAATLTADTTVNSLVVERNFTMNNNVDLVLNSGGLILAGSSTGSAYGPNNGSNLASITSAFNSGAPSAPNELFVYAANQGGDTRITGVNLIDNGGTPVQLVKGGPGQIIYQGNAGFTGGMLINEGTWQADFRTSRTPINAAVGELTVRSGGILSFGLDTSPVSLSNTVNLDGGVLRNDNNGGGGGNVLTLTGTLNVTSLDNHAAFIDARQGRNIILSPTATLTGSGDLSRVSTAGTAATLDIQTANTSGFTGNMIINAGTTQVSGAGVLPNVDYYLNGGTLGITTTTGSTLRSLAGVAGSVTGTAGGSDSLTVNQAIDTAYHGSVVDTQLIKSGAGHLNLAGSADNASAALTLTAGMLTLGKATDRGIHAAGSTLTVSGGTARLGGTYAPSGTGLGAPPTFVNASGTTVNLETQPGFGDQIHDGQSATVNGGVLDLNGRTEMVNTLDGAGGQVRNDGSAASTLVVGRNNGSGSYAGSINDGASTLSLVKVGTGTQTLSGTGAFSGKTTIAGGTLQITSGNEASLGANPGASTFDQLTLSGGTLQVSTADLTLNDANRGIAISANNGTFNVDGGRVLSVSNALAGAPGILNKAGAGAFNMTGNASVASFVTSAGIYNQNAGTTTVGTAGGANVSSGATYSLAGGVLRTDVVNVTAGGTFNWGAELTMRQSQAGVTPSGVDFSTGPLPGAPVVRTGTVIQGSGALTGGNNAVLNLDGLYVSGGILLDRMEVAGSVTLAGVGDQLQWDNSTVYLLRPFGFFTEDYGSIPLLAASSITGTFDTFSGLTDDGKGYTQLATVVGGPLINPSSLNANEGVLQYAYGVVNPDGFTAGTYDLIYFHYKVQGAVPEPDTFALLALSVIGLRTARVLRDRRARLG